MIHPSSQCIAMTTFGRNPEKPHGDTPPAAFPFESGILNLPRKPRMEAATKATPAARPSPLQGLWFKEAAAGTSFDVCAHLQRANGGFARALQAASRSCRIIDCCRCDSAAWRDQTTSERHPARLASHEVGADACRCLQRSPAAESRFPDVAAHICRSRGFQESGSEMEEGRCRPESNNDQRSRHLAGPKTSAASVTAAVLAPSRVLKSATPRLKSGEDQNSPDYDCPSKQRCTEDGQCKRRRSEQTSLYTVGETENHQVFSSGESGRVTFRSFIEDQFCILSGNPTATDRQRRRRLAVNPLSRISLLGDVRGGGLSGLRSLCSGSSFTAVQFTQTSKRSPNVIRKPCVLNTTESATDE